MSVLPLSMVTQRGLVCVFPLGMVAVTPLACITSIPVRDSQMKSGLRK